jgi:hypothetical protein
MISTFPLAVITPACGGSGSEPTPVSVAGGWVGTVQDNIVGAENRWTPILLHRTSVIQVYGDDREVELQRDLHLPSYEFKQVPGRRAD